jgi:hypothetical protein
MPRKSLVCRSLERRRRISDDLSTDYRKPPSFCSGSHSAQAFGDIQEGAAIVVRGFQDPALVGVHRTAIRTHHFIDSMEFGIDLIVLDKVSLQLEGLEIDVSLPPIFFVHQEKGIQSFP